MKQINHSIGGRDTPSSECFLNYCPATGEVISQVTMGGRKEISLAVEAAKTALRESKWAEWELSDRGNILTSIADLIEQHREELARAESLDTGKPLSESLEGDIPRAASNFRFFAEFARTHPLNFEVSDAGSRHRANYEPLGIVGLITPWNLPLYLATWKLAPALIMGNAVILKPAELTPTTASMLVDLCTQAGLPPGILNVVHGFGAGSAGEALVEHPEVSAISFTGETTTGRHIMQTAAPTLKKLSFELGGKGASVIFDDADLKKAVPVSIKAAFRNQGQICLAGSRLLVHQSIRDEVIDKVRSAVDQIKLGPPLDPTTQMGSVISLSHRDRILAFIDGAKSAGNEIHQGRSGEADFERGAFVRPTLVIEPDQNSEIIQNEVFGPVLTIQSFNSDEIAVQYLNGTKYGLSCSLWSSDPERLDRISKQARFGLIWQNSWFLRELSTPFGGMKQSGLGREGGRYSLEFFSTTKTISAPMEIQ